jgi:hypothetical protein
VNFEICVESFEQIFLFLNMTDMYRDYWGDYYTRSQNAFSLSLSLVASSFSRRRSFVSSSLSFTKNSNNNNNNINVSGEEAGHRLFAKRR